MKHIVLKFLIASLVFVGCDYLDMVPEKDIETVESIFEQRANADEWIAGVYAEVALAVANFAENEAFLGGDEFVAGDYLRDKSISGTYTFRDLK